MMEIEHMDRVKCYTLLNYGQVLCRMNLPGFLYSAILESSKIKVKWSGYTKQQENIRKYPYWWKATH